MTHMHHHRNTHDSHAPSPKHTITATHHHRNTHGSHAPSPQHTRLPSSTADAPWRCCEHGEEGGIVVNVRDAWGVNDVVRASAYMQAVTKQNNSHRMYLKKKKNHKTLLYPIKYMNLCITSQLTVCSSKQRRGHYLIHKDNYDRLNMIGRERANRALIGCESQ